MKRASISIACIIVSIVLVQLPLRAQAPQQKRIASSTGQIVKLKRSPASLVMAKAFSEGKLPEPARLPRGGIRDTDGSIMQTNTF